MLLVNYSEEQKDIRNGRQTEKSIQDGYGPTECRREMWMHITNRQLFIITYTEANEDACAYIKVHLISSTGRGGRGKCKSEQAEGLG